MITTAYFHPNVTPVENAKMGAFVCGMIWDGERQVNNFCSMAVFDDDKLIAGTLYHNWCKREGVIELTSASLSRRWLTRPVINAMFSLPFDTLGCQLVALRVSERNTPMVRIARSFGFEEVYLPRMRGRDEGEYLFTFTDDAWRVSRYRKEAA